MMKRKRYCPVCGGRVRRSAYRCLRCNCVTFPRRFYAALAALLLVLSCLALKYLHAI